MKKSVLANLSPTNVAMPNGSLEKYDSTPTSKAFSLFEKG
jgi:hypothetical protein